MRSTVGLTPLCKRWLRIPTFLRNVTEDELLEHSQRTITTQRQSGTDVSVVTNTRTSSTLVFEEGRHSQLFAGLQGGKT
jgi:hypothetical protein